LVSRPIEGLRRAHRCPAAKKLRKDELEKAIVVFLRTGNAALPTTRSLRKTGVKDVERGLHLKLRIENYTSNRVTKDFIIEQARMMAPEVREKSGSLVPLEPVARRTDHEREAPHVRRSRPAVRCPEQDAAIRPNPVPLLHQLRS
jgi:hypothetical protein